MGDIVFAEIDGKLQSWTNSYSGEAPTPPPAAETPAYTGEAFTPPAAEATTSPSAEAPAPTSAASDTYSSPSAEAPSPSEYGSGSDDNEADSTGDWERLGYYNANDQTLDGMVFLNNKGGQGSGVFD